MLALHAWEPRSRANGPGQRLVLWFQGCTLGCPGCFNPDTHDPGAPRLRVGVDEVMGWVAAARGIEGVTLSGGEPMQQPEAALALLERLRAETSLSTLMFSGYTLDEIAAMPLGPAILGHLDVLIDGRYVARERQGRGLRGSANQQIRLLSGRYRTEEVAATPEAEIRIGPDGSVTLTGVNPLRLKR
jgi:anaerobic ribonucleoside-triphosphate reductase activating protein